MNENGQKERKNQHLGIKIHRISDEGIVKMRDYLLPKNVKRVSKIRSRLNL